MKNTPRPKSIHFLIKVQGIGSALLLACLATGCAGFHSRDARSDNPAARAQIEQRLQEVLDAAEKKDFDRLDSYHLYGPNFTKFTASSPERLDAAAARKGEHDGLGSINGLKMLAGDLKIDVLGNVGIATCILDYSFEAGGKTVQGHERSTLVFVKDAGQWKIIHEHLSPITP